MKKPPNNGEGDEEDEPQDLWDICRNYHGGNPESEAANSGADKSGGWLKVRAALEAAGFEGANVWEVRQATGLSHQSASARLSESKRDGRTVLKPSGQKPPDKSYLRRPTGTGCLAAVHILPKFKPGVVVPDLEM